MKREAELLDVTKYFGRHIYGALDDYKQFSKKIVIDRLLAENRISGDQLLSFGDGYVEIENTKQPEIKKTMLARDSDIEDAFDDSGSNIPEFGSESSSSGSNISGGATGG